MANDFVRFPNSGGDLGTWDTYAEPNIRGGALGHYSCNLYDNAGALTLSKGAIGIDDGTNEGISRIDTITVISMAAVSNANWAKIEMTVAGAGVSFAASDIAGATDPAALPAGFTGAYNPEKAGFYITGTKRCIGLAWKNTGGTLEGIVNVLPYMDGYIGYSISDDANDIRYSFFHNGEDAAEYTEHDKVFYQDDTPAESVVKVYTKVIEIGAWNMQGSVNIDVAHGLGSRDKIISVDVVIRPDGATYNFNLSIRGTSTSDGYYYVDNTNVRLIRVAGRHFDHADYNSTSINRGWIFLRYVKICGIRNNYGKSIYTRTKYLL
jgi:hypothetical protein